MGWGGCPSLSTILKIDLQLQVLCYILQPQLRQSGRREIGGRRKRCANTCKARHACRLKALKVINRHHVARMCTFFIYKLGKVCVCGGGSDGFLVSLHSYIQTCDNISVFIRLRSANSPRALRAEAVKQSVSEGSAFICVYMYVCIGKAAGDAGIVSRCRPATQALHIAAAVTYG